MPNAENTVPASQPEVKLLTESDMRRFSKWAKKFSPGDLEILAKILWNIRQEQYKQWDKSILGNPQKGKRYG